MAPRNQGHSKVSTKPNRVNFNLADVSPSPLQHYWSLGVEDS
jgi:hypothetical protein